MPFVPRTQEQLTSSQIRGLRENTPITNFSAGSRARAILELINDDISEFENRLSLNTALSFVSQANGRFLDMIGELLSCERRPDEGDEGFRYRIVNHVHTVAGANETALRLACLSVDGVRDIKLVPYTHGTGSFSVYVVPEDSNYLNEAIDGVSNAVEEIKAYGIKGNVLSPKIIPVQISVRLITKPMTDSRGLINDVRFAIRYYFESRDLGQNLIINELVNSIMNVSNDIIDIQIYDLYLGNKKVLVQNQDIHWDEKFTAPQDNIKVI